MKDQHTTDGNGLWYGMTFTGEEVGEVYYDLNEDIKYYAEVENLTPSRSWAAYGNATNRYSAGKAVRFAKGASTTTDAITEAGTYYFTLFARNQSSSSSSTLNVYVVDTDGTETLVEEGFENWGKADMSAKTITVTIPSGGKLKIENPSTEDNSNIEMDYLYLQLKPEMYNAIINAVDESGTLLTELKNEEVIKGETKTLYFSKGLQIDDVWNIADQLTTAVDGLWYGAEFEEGNTVDVVFKKNTDIVYFAEMEDLTPSRSYATTASKQVTNRTSNGKIGRLAIESYVKTASLPEGTYNITLWGRSSASSDANVKVFIEDASGAQTEIANGFEAWAGGGAGTGEKTITGVEVPAGGAIVLKNSDTDNNSNLEMDYIYIDKKPVSNVSTAIKNVQIESEDNSIYNLQGQRVSQPTHGIFVKNGKKVIMK